MPKLFNVCLTAVNMSFTGACWPCWTNRPSRTQGRSWWIGECGLGCGLLGWTSSGLILLQFDPFTWGTGFWVRLQPQFETCPWDHNVLVYWTETCWTSGTDVDSHIFDWIFLLCVCEIAQMRDSSQWNILQHTHIHTQRQMLWHFPVVDGLYHFCSLKMMMAVYYHADSNGLQADDQMEYIYK